MLNESFVPILIDNINDVTFVSNSNATACAVSGGALKCWGDNSSGELGLDPDYVKSSGPMIVPGFESGTTFVELTKVEAANAFACGIKEKVAYCWGRGRLYDSNGLFGPALLPDSQHVPMAVPTLPSGVTSISVGASHACAVVDGAAYCWGIHSKGQLGDGKEADNGYRSPVRVVGFSSGVTDIASGYFHNCAVVLGKVKCWGLNSGGQLGDGKGGDTSNNNGGGSAMKGGGDASSQNYSTTPVEVAGLSDVTRVTASFVGTCALTRKGEVWCWGRTVFGKVEPVPVLVSGASGFVDVALGLTLVAKDADGQLFTAGNGNTSAMALAGYVPTAWESGGFVRARSAEDDLIYKEHLPSADAVSKPAVQIAAGVYHTCAVLQSGEVKCWGIMPGRLQDWGVSKESDIVSISGISAPSEVAVRDDCMCAVASGAVKCWGNLTNCLGLSDPAFSAEAYPFASLTSGVSQISGGHHAPGGQTHACVIQSGSVKCWGHNNVGQLGNGATSDSPQFTQVAVSGLGSNVTMIAVGGAHSCAIENGSLKCWGLNDSGQLGNGTRDNSPVAVQVSGLTSSVTHVACGGYHTCAVHSGNLKCWGNNRDGQIGNRNPSYETFPTPVEVTGISASITKISLGVQHSCAIAGGDAYCWGNGEFGQLGSNVLRHAIRYGEKSWSWINPEKVSFLPGSVTSLALGYSHTCVVSDSKVFCWGYNYGFPIRFRPELGNGSKAFVPIWVPIVE
jgi:alpha-tubulin suppressor-like RCC1 family protein